jgi:hypothetical protein
MPSAWLVEYADEGLIGELGAKNVEASLDLRIGQGFDKYRSAWTFSGVPRNVSAIAWIRSTFWAPKPQRGPDRVPLRADGAPVSPFAGMWWL